MSPEQPNNCTPEFVYRLATTAEWRIAQDAGVVPRRDIDVRDGYMHLSTRPQVLETARLHFSGVNDLLTLEIPLAPIGDLVKFELAPKRGETFPHLYSSLRREYVRAAIKLELSEYGFVFGAAL